MSTIHAADKLPEFVSDQVSEARRFFLNLNSTRKDSLEVICGGVERMRPDYVVDRKNFPYYAIELVAEGEGSVVLNGTEYALSAGSIFAYGPDTPHTIRCHPTHVMKKYYLDFVGSDAVRLLKRAKLKTDAKSYAAFVTGGVHELIDLFELLLRNGINSGPLVPAICTSLTQLLFLKIQQLSLPQGEAVPKAYATYERIRHYIDNQFLLLHSAKDIAKQCAVTPVHLSRLFGRYCDCGAYQYLLRRKMNYAAGLLMKEGLLVKEVAQKLGFADAFRFSRSFKRVFGIAPNHIKYVKR